MFMPLIHTKVHTLKHIAIHKGKIIYAFLDPGYCHGADANGKYWTENIFRIHTSCLHRASALTISLPRLPDRTTLPV